ncbi:MAG: TonB-dependent receptor plug domain-containing protein [Bacteroides pyogenes]|uniref:TonB-dependent receptor n=1 Tax=Bacteroides pyogenes TaxID=310300 RepID=UPI002A909E85|nr:TonB-dependent receptor [Bacteroides pyogenes]MDY5353113.1 TonB-dependent receptor plug domain-containing protein [Bacteroides pyogenes]
MRISTCKKLLISILGCLGCLDNPAAQTVDSIAMYGQIDTVEIVAQRIRHMDETNAGAKIVSINSKTLQANKTRSLAEILTDHTPVYIKSTGTGALATASFRGGSASQTRVNWNGINITPPMSGTFDFSQIPVFFIDNIDLYFGSSHTKNGTGAITGSVNLFSNPDWNSGPKGKIFAEYGSYNTYTAGGQLNIGKKRKAEKTRIYYQHSDNSYTYLNKILTNNPFREKRQDADYTQWGMTREDYFRLSPYMNLTTIGWLQQGKRMLPPPLGVVNTSHEQQKETNLRTYAGMDYRRGIHELRLKSSWLYYRQKYEQWYDNRFFDPKGNINSSHTWQGIVDYSCAPSNRLILNTTLTYSHDLIKIKSYIDIDSSKYIIDDVHYDIPVADAPFTHHRNILSWQTSTRWNPIQWLLVNGQYMFEQNDRKGISTWSAGFLVNLWQKELQIKGNVAYNYRFPSMNDLYWRPGGNPNVKPEEGYSYDASVSYKKKLNELLILNGEFSGYLMHIDNWIVWLPKDGNQWIWTPQNKRDVLSAGIEFYGKAEFKKGDWETVLSGNFSWTQSRTRKKQHEDDHSYMKQIPYVPKYKWNMRLELNYKKGFLSCQTSYIGKRYITTDQSYSTASYSVHNLLAGYQFEIGKRFTLTPQLRIDNLLDTYYESTQYYPMPLRNCLLSLMLEF